MAALDTATSTESITNAGLGLFLRHWDPPQGTATRAVLVLLHGYSWHSLYFGEFAAAAADQGFAVVACDLQGHGKSDGFRGMRGYANKFQDFVDDARLVVHRARQAHPGLACFVCGESMGGTILLRMLQQSAELRRELAGAILLGPAIRVSASLLPPAPVMAIVRLLARFFPTMQMPDDRIKEGFEGAFGDAEFAKRAKQDPLVVLERPRIGMAVQTIDACRQVAHALEDIDLPFLALHGTLDDRTDSANTEELGRRSRSHDKTVVLVEGARHQLLQDTPQVKGDVFARVLSWMRARCVVRPRQ